MYVPVFMFVQACKCGETKISYSTIIFQMPSWLFGKLDTVSSRSWAHSNIVWVISISMLLAIVLS